MKRLNSFTSIEDMTVREYLDQTATDNNFLVKSVHDAKQIIPNLDIKIFSVDNIRRSLLDASIKKYIR